MAARKQLVIIPGLGDRGWLYYFIKPLWALFGYKVHIFVFGWNEEGVASEEAQNRLNTFIRGLGGKTFLIGVSAGGTAAINALAAYPTAIAKVVTVCTPYQQVPRLRNKLLVQSINRASRNLSRMERKMRARVLSLDGMYDQVVPTTHSKPNDIRSGKVFAVGHGPSIVMCLSIYNRIIREFFV